MSWIEGWKPEWVSDKEQAIDLLKEKARAWVGSKIEATYIGWLEEHNEWFPDVPVVLIIAGKQYEICWQKFDELSITENQINLDVHETAAGVPISMRLNALPEFRKAVGRKILAIELGENEMGFGERGVDRPMRIVNSVNFILEGGYLAVFNAMDENGVSGQPCSEGTAKIYEIRI